MCIAHILILGAFSGTGGQNREADAKADDEPGAERPGGPEVAVVGGGARSRVHEPAIEEA